MLTQRPYYCGNCTYFLNMGDGENLRTDKAPGWRMGECRRNPPSIDGKWPTVRFLDFCGEHPTITAVRTTS